MKHLERRIDLGGRCKVFMLVSGSVGACQLEGLMLQ